LLSVIIHGFIILLVIPAGDVVQPGLVVEVPADGLLDAFLELQRRFPAQFALELGAVDGVAEVVAGAIRHIGDEVVVGTLRTAQEAVRDADEGLHDVDVLPLVEPADVVGLGNLPFVEDQVDGAGVVLHIQPVPDILALSVHRKRFPLADVVDKQRDELLRELIRPIVVGTVRDDGGHSVGVMERAHEMVAGRLRRAVRTVWLVLEVLGEELVAVSQMMLSAGSLGREGRLDPLRMRQLQGAVHLVGGDVVETLAFVLLRQALPVRLGGLQHGQGADDVGLREGEGVLDGAVHMGFRREVDDAAHLVFGDDLQYRVKVADVGLDKGVVGLVLDIPEVREVAGIGQLVQVDDPVIRILVHEQPHDVAADEAGTAGNEDGFG